MRNALIILTLAVMTIFSISCVPGKKAETQNAATPAGAQSKLNWLGFDQALTQAAQEKKPVIVDFYTDWCHWCKVMEEKTYTDPAVIKIVTGDFVLAKINPEKDVKYAYLGKACAGEDLMKAFGVSGFPTTVFLKSDGSLIRADAGYIETAPFIEILNGVKAKAK